MAAAEGGGASSASPPPATVAPGLDIPERYSLTDDCGFRVAELRDFLWVFKLQDILGDGLITTKAARTAVSMLGEEPKEQDWLRILNEVDGPDAHNVGGGPKPRGVLNFQQFVKMMTFFDRSVLTEEELVEAFKIFDRDKSGTIDAIELQDVLAKLGFKVSDLEARDMIKEADSDGGGDVSFSEFAQN
eukprot:CAMPEP_0178422452 /NCGR_PEP_ID=MMETSP0689_2-20121128/27182_1 /TAXON_ID=160604 /ORGANISM="Amphidinium massartii, Strain CS-259" /LENGTH=187 /DNA_ID=CAMNT_0020044019 /DNA_START=26 /DNA_END=586 /DNA_ORIENTATION=+